MGKDSWLRKNDDGGAYDPLTDPHAVWRRQPASAQQLLLLQKLGIHFSRNITSGAASDLIEAYEPPKTPEAKAPVINITQVNRGCGDGCGRGCAVIIAGVIVLAVVGHLMEPAKPRSDAVARRSTVPAALPEQSLTEAETAAAKQRAIARFPQLGVAGSRLNVAFVARVAKYRAEKPAFFNYPDWPTAIAEEVSAEL